MNHDLPDVSCEWPLISCLMVTRGRLEFVRQAVLCYLRQTYPRKELLIVCADPNGELQTLVDRHGRSDIRLIPLTSPDLSLGDKRNVAVDNATGDYLCIWDDDDIHHAQRLSQQFESLRKTRSQACVLSRLMIWWPAQQRLVCSEFRLWEGSLMCEVGYMPRYPSLNRAEDTPVVEQLQATVRLVRLSAPQLYTYVVHGNNTWHSLHFESLYWSAQERYTHLEYAAKLGLLMQDDGVANYPVGLAAVPEIADAASGLWPLISCLMVTRGRVEWVRQALGSYIRQTYPRKELVIVCDATNEPLRQLLKDCGREDVRLLQAPSADLKLGALRNFAVDQALGDYVCQWDDDDLYDPQRLQLQFATLQKTLLPACILTRWVVWSPAQKRLAISPARAWEGSLLCQRSVLPRYPALSKGEDTPVIEALVNSGQVAFMDAPWMYVYVIHGNNTWSGSHFDEIFDKATQTFDGERYAGMLDLMNERLHVNAYPVSQPASSVVPNNDLTDL